MAYSNSWFGPRPSIPITTSTGGDFGAAATRTISGGNILRAGAGRNLLIIGEGASNDDLDNILGYSEGDMIIISPQSDTVTITVKDSADMNLQGVDFVMNDIYDSLILLNIGSDKWKELSRSAN